MSTNGKIVRDTMNNLLKSADALDSVYHDLVFSGTPETPGVIHCHLARSFRRIRFCCHNVETVHVALIQIYIIYEYIYTYK